MVWVLVVGGQGGDGWRDANARDSRWGSMRVRLARTPSSASLLRLARALGGTLGPLEEDLVFLDPLKVPILELNFETGPLTAVADGGIL